MSLCVWYISKYIAPPYAANVGARGFFLLKEFVKNGCQAYLITSDSNHLATPPKLSGPHLFENIDGVDVCWLKTMKYKGARSLGRMLSWLDFEFRLFLLPKSKLSKPDVVIVSSLSLLTILNGFLLRRKYGCKLIFEVRDIWPMVLTEAGGLSTRNPFVIFLRLIEKAAYKHSDLIVGTMPNLKDHVKSVLGYEKRVVCVPQGLDESLLSTPEALSDDYIESYIPKDKFVVCHAGSIGADNALETLIECAKVMKDRQDVHFLIVGEGYLKAKFQLETEGLENITFAPRVSKAAVQSVLNFADIVYFAVHKSPMLQFGQSLNKVIDYMLSGKPIVASFTGFPSMINESGCGTFVPAEDVPALIAAIDYYAALSPDERSRIGGKGKKWLLENRRYTKLANDYMQHIGSFRALNRDLN